ncbi:MAG: UDP-GlcNAc:undecaprenyl-phosphate/decaprenyl-phosphate GlcNAc-1-phosphate transferase [Methyloprofundus sp.]|nr:MAG: UDP-GlcNAc:undecaprenyl-phosphate/decaprenyl-phosphate GlcNAc-1-phosphate transferase [Methyloprofundus sp.]
MTYLLSFLIAILVSWGLIPSLVRYAPQLGMLDAPGERKMHSTVIPRCGGIGIALGAICATVALVPLSTVYFSLIIGGIIIVLFGVADDILDINYKWKFLGQTIAVCFVISQGVYIKVVPFMGMNEAPLLVSYTLTFLFVIGSTNAVNLSDGLDGLAAGIMLLSFACIAVLGLFSGGLAVSIMAIAVIGGIIGFLRFNTYPAMVFMGDAGSQFIGFMAALLAITLTQHVSTALNPALPLLIMGLPILDTLSVMVQRVRVGRSPFSPDKRHIHHKLLTYGFTHEQSVVAIYILQVVFLISAFLLKYSADWEVVGLYVLISSALLVAFYLAGSKHWLLNTGDISIDKRKNRLRRYQWIFPFCRNYIEYSIIIYLILLSLQLIFVIRPEWYLELIFLLVALLILKWVPNKAQGILIRVGIYSSVLVGCYQLFNSSYLQELLLNAVDLFFILLLMVVTVAIRVTRKAYFKLTTQDVLVLLFVIAALFVVEVEFVARALFYLFCLGYALEYLFHRDAYMFRALRVLAFFCMLNFSVFLSIYS